MQDSLSLGPVKNCDFSVFSPKIVGGEPVMM